MKNLYYSSLIVSIWLLCLGSCKTPPCSIELVRPVIELRFIDATTNDTINPQYDQIYSIEDNIQDRNYTAFGNIGQSFPLYLSTTRDQTTYVFEKANQPTDTLVIHYKRIFITVDPPECGTGVTADNVTISPKSTFKTTQIMLNDNTFLSITL